MKLQSHSSVCRSRRKLERGSEMYKTKTNHTLSHWKYLRCILTIAWNCSGSVSLILFPTSMAPTMVRHQIFSTSENNIGNWYWHRLGTSVLVLARLLSYKRIDCNMWHEIYTSTKSGIFHSCKDWSHGFHFKSLFGSHWFSKFSFVFLSTSWVFDSCLEKGQIMAVWVWWYQQ